MKSREKLKRGPVALYEQMRVKILELIKERKLKPHDPIPSEGELADLFGVSRRTSKQALQILADEGVVYRMPRRGTFLADGDGANSAMVVASKSRTIGFIVPEINDYIGQILAAAIEEAKKAGYQILLRISNANLQSEADILKELVDELTVEGILLFPGDRTSCGTEVLRLHLDHFPVVIVDRVFKEINIPSVYHDHYQGAYEVTKYLIDSGHTHIGFVSEPILGVMSREERYYGYMQAHQDMNVVFFPKSRFSDLHLTEGASRIPELERYLLENPEMTAVFCSNDYVALFVGYAADNLGISVPEQLSLVGFTDLPVCEWMKVPLTTVKKSTDELGKEAVSLILERIRQPEAEHNSRILNTQVHERGSVRNLLQR